MSDTNKAIVRRLYEDVLNTGNLALVDDLCAPTYVLHFAGYGDIEGIEGFKHYATMFRTAFPDAQLTIEEMIAEGDIVAVRYSAHGTNHGSYRGMPPTGIQAQWTGMWFNRLAAGEIVEDWIQSDTFGVLQQLGAVSLPG